MSLSKHGQYYFDPRTICHADRIHAWQKGEYFPPVVVEINPTSVCNQRCRYCYVAGRTKGVLGDDILKKLMPQLSYAGVRAVVFQGAGEPLLHPAVPDAIAVAVDSGLAVSLTTNGVLLSNPIQEKILDKLTYIKFSNLDNNATRYGFVHGCPEKQWDTVISNIKNAIAKRAQDDLSVFFLATVYITRDNFNDIYDIVKYLKELGIDYVSIQEAVYNEYSYAGRQPLASGFFTPAEIETMKIKVLTLKDNDFFVRIRFPLTDNTFINGRYGDCWVNNWCQGIKFNTLIDSDGEVYACFRYWGMKEFSYGNICEKTFEEIWRGPKRKEMEKHTNCTPPQGDECSTCNVTKINEILRQINNSDNKFKNFLI